MPFDATEVLLLVLVVTFAGWAVRSMILAQRTDARRRGLLRTFAADHGLREKEAGEPPFEAEVTAEGMMRGWSRNPALAHPPRGAAVLEGTLQGLRFVVDEVWIRKWWSNARDGHLRMAVELPGLPSGLDVSPADRMRRLLRRVREGTGSHPAGRPSRLAVRFSRRAEDRTREEAFLTPGRTQVLEDHAGGADGAYLHGGFLFLIRPWKAIRESELARLHEEIGLLTRRLVGDSSARAEGPGAG